jgi:hypothetical protein
MLSDSWRVERQHNALPNSAQARNCTSNQVNRQDYRTAANPSKTGVEFGGTLAGTTCLAPGFGPELVEDVLCRMMRASGYPESF